MSGFAFLFASVAQAQSGTVTYEYDALGRLVEASYGADGTVEYSYVPNGNRTQIAITASSVGGLQSPFDLQPAPVDPVNGLIDYPARQWDYGGQGISFNETMAHHENGDTIWRASGGIESYEPWWTHGAPPPSAVSYTYAGMWVEYTINVTQADTYDLMIEAASGRTGEQVGVSFTQAGASSSYIDATVTLTNTGGWQNFQDSAAVPVSLNAGEQAVRLTYLGSEDASNTSSFTIMPSGGAPPSGTQTAYGATSSVIDASVGLVDFPAREWDQGGLGIAFNETETAHVGGHGSWRATDGIESYTRSNGPPSAMTYTQNGEWVEYTIDVLQAGDYDVTLLVAVDDGDRQVQIGFDKTDQQTWTQYQGGATIASNTGNWNVFAETSPVTVSLDSGKQVMRLTYAGNATDTVSFSIVPAGPANNPPVAVDDTKTHNGATQTDLFITVLSNDSDPDGDALVVSLVGDSQGVHGAASVLSDNQINYIFDAAPGSYTETFSYQVSDGRGGSDTATITIQLNINNDPPP